MVFPFQVLAVGWYHKRSIVNKILAAPYKIWDQYLFRGGWTRYMLHEVAYLPSHHVRRFIYKSLGVNMGKGNVFHYGTEIRMPENIRMGGQIQLETTWCLTEDEGWR